MLTTVTSPLSLLEVPIKGKITYRFTQLQEELVLRKSNFNIKLQTRVKQRSRDEVVANLAQILKEGLPYRIYRLDIKSFYESFDLDMIYEKINKETYFDPHTKKLVISFFSNYVISGGKGLPRGLSISATLAEYLMGPFDRYVLRSNNVSFYARYVDDIVIVTSGNENPHEFLNKIKKILPNNLEFSKKKEYIKEVIKVKTVKKPTDAKISAKFDYLGYKFTISDPIKISDLPLGKHFRELNLDIADNKVNKIKFKVTKSLMEFHRKGNYNLLKNRIKLLTNNYNVLDRSLGIKINVGIYSSYHRVQAEKSVGLKALDIFLAKAIFSKNFHKPPHKKFFLSVTQKNELVKASFYSGFTNKSFVHFSPSMQIKIQKCWTYAV